MSLHPAKFPGAAARSRLWPGLAAVLLVYALLGVPLARTRAPVCDEGYYGHPAHNLAAHGNMGSPMLVALERLRGIERYTYWAMPLHILALAAWDSIFGVGVFSFRVLGLLWGALALLS